MLTVIYTDYGLSSMNKVTKDILYVGVNDHQVDLFEGQYDVPNGMAYNSYVIVDEKIAVVDTVDKNFTHEWLDNVAEALDGRYPDYLIVQHMEPDHSANIMNFLKAYPKTSVSLLKAVAREGCVKELLNGDFISKHKLRAASSVSYSLKKLIDKELLYESDNGYIVYDRFMAEWLRRQPF